MKNFPGESSGRRRLVGCGCLFLLSVGILAAVLFLVYGYPMIRAIREEPSLPDLPAVADTDLWSLDEKLKRVDEPGSAKLLALTPGEGNALLARFDPIPCMGFALDRVRAIPGSGSMLLYAQGSGWWIRKVTIIIEASSPTPDRIGPLHLRILQVNRLEVGPGWLGDFFRQILSQYLEKTLAGSIDGSKVLNYTWRCSPSRIEFDLSARQKRGTP